MDPASASPATASTVTTTTRAAAAKKNKKKKMDVIPSSCSRASTNEASTATSAEEHRRARWAAAQRRARAKRRAATEDAAAENEHLLAQLDELRRTWERTRDAWDDIVRTRAGGDESVANENAELLRELAEHAAFLQRALVARDALAPAPDPVLVAASRAGDACRNDVMRVLAATARLPPGSALRSGFVLSPGAATRIAVAAVPADSAWGGPCHVMRFDVTITALPSGVDARAVRDAFAESYVSSALETTWGRGTVLSQTLRERGADTRGALRASALRGGEQDVVEASRRADFVDPAQPKERVEYVAFSSVRSERHALGTLREGERCALDADADADGAPGASGKAKGASPHSTGVVMCHSLYRSAAPVRGRPVGAKTDCRFEQGQREGALFWDQGASEDGRQRRAVRMCYAAVVPAQFALPTVSAALQDVVGAYERAVVPGTRGVAGEARFEWRARSSQPLRCVTVLKSVVRAARAAEA